MIWVMWNFILRMRVKRWVLTSDNVSARLQMTTSQRLWKCWDHSEWHLIMEIQWRFQRLNTRPCYLPSCRPPCSLKLTLWQKVLEAKRPYMTPSFMRPPYFLKLPLWLKLTLFSGALNRFPKIHHIVKIVCEPNTYLTLCVKKILLWQ